jgi:hypothetical protein
MKKPRPSAPDERARIDGAEETTTPEPGGRDGPPPPPIEPEEMGGEAPCHLPRFWDVEE